ncbi:MAG: SoxR reducing system RseC family protein [Oscillospiraceae bacterium]|nr:SoxR reducing system RseC family protein [Oscillospiraceae bacterium]
MRQTVEVKRILDTEHAEVFLERESACSGDCHRCGGCGAARQTLFVRAENPIGAQPGDRVTLESDTGVVLGAAMLVYALPILMFFVGYFLGNAVSRLPGLWGGVGFVLGMVPALLWNRRLEKKNTVRFRITGFVQE